ncbi:MAG: protein kinase [Kofleriaceae bacterium]
MASRFGAYELLHELKSGGMGSIWLGRRRGPGAFEQLVAIKTIRSEYAGAAAVRAMFLDEAAILARINHPGIATVHDFGEEAGTLYMVMEYVAGISFRALVDSELSPGVAARAIVEAARGLHAAHEVCDSAGNVMGVVHRDISPDNLMLGFDGHVKVIDFGIALVKNRQAPVTEFGTVKGKPPYMSPEQVKNEPMDRRSDVFSLAVVLHEMLTRQPLFDGDSIYAVARAVEHQPIPLPSQVRGEPLPIGLDAAVMNALDRDVARRTPSAAALAEELERVVATAGDETLEAWAERELEQPRNAHRSWLAGVVAGRDAPRPVGRASGAQTQVAPLADTEGAPVAAAVAKPEQAAPTSTHVPPDVDDASEPGRRRSSLVPALASLVVLLAIGGGFWTLRGRSAAAPAPDAGVAIRDAVVIAPLDSALRDGVTADVLVPADAAVVDAMVVDAGRLPSDARRRTLPRDATTRTTEPDAPVVEQVTGFGTADFRSRPDSFANVTLDGVSLGATPVLKKKLAAGAHTVVFNDPKTGAQVWSHTFRLKPGEHAPITQP